MSGQQTLEIRGTITKEMGIGGVIEQELINKGFEKLDLASSPITYSRFSKNSPVGGSIYHAWVTKTSSEEFLEVFAEFRREVAIMTYDQNQSINSN